jgi:hypothetical protein
MMQMEFARTDALPVEKRNSFGTLSIWHCELKRKPWRSLKKICAEVPARTNRRKKSCNDALRTVPADPGNRAPPTRQRQRALTTVKGMFTMAEINPSIVSSSVARSSTVVPLSGAGANATQRQGGTMTTARQEEQLSISPGDLETGCVALMAEVSGIAAALAAIVRMANPNDHEISALAGDALDRAYWLEDDIDMFRETKMTHWKPAMRSHS